MKKTVSAALVLLTALLCACASPAAADINAPEISAITEAALPAPAQDAALAQVSLGIDRAAHEYHEDILMYPQVTGDAAGIINKSLFDELTNRISGISEPVYTSYRIENNAGGLFSVLIYVYDLKSGEQLELIPLTYDMRSGQKLAISDLFSAENDRWRRVLPDIVTEQANARAIPLLCEVMPIADDQEYYIAGSSLVLVYKLYEISTFSAGRPEFPILMSELAELLPEDGRLAPFIGEAEEASADEAEPGPADEEPAADGDENAEPEGPATETDAPIVAVGTPTDSETAAGEADGGTEQAGGAEAEG